MTLHLSPSFSCDDVRCRLTDGYIFIMLLVFPLFTGFHGYTALTASKFALLIGITVAWLVCLAVSSIRCRAALPRPGCAQLPALAFLFIACLSALLSQYGTSCILGAGRYDGLVSTACYTLIFLGVSLFGRFGRCHAAAFGISVSLCCVVALLQLFGKNPLSLFPGDYCYYDAHIRFTSEFLGTVGNVDLLADILCLSAALFFALSVLFSGAPGLLSLIPLFFSVLILASSGVSGGAAACCAAFLIALPLLLTDIFRVSRAITSAAVCALSLSLALSIKGGYNDGVLSVALSPGRASVICIAASAVCFALGLILPRLRFRPGAKTLRVFFSALSACAIVLCIAAVWFYPGSRGTIYELSQLLHGRFDDSFGSSRLLIWRKVLALVPEHPLLGAGPGTLPLRLDIEFSRYVPETGKTLRSYVDNAHNVYLQTLAEFGAAGLAAFIAMIARSLICSLKSSEPAGPALFLAALCACAHAFFGLGLCVTAPIFWIFLGLAAACARRPA